MRTDISTLHNKGSIRVPGSFGESTGNVKQVIGNQNTDENNYENYPPDHQKYLLNPNEPFPDELIKHSPPQGVLPSSGGYNALDDVFASKVDKEYIWLWDETDNRFIYHLNIDNGKRLVPYYDHLTLGKHNDVKRITNEGWRGRIFIYTDRTADIQWYGDENINDAPKVVINGFNNIIKDNNIENVELERISDWPSAEWEAEGWKYEEKNRQLAKHMERRKMMGYDDPDPEFVKQLDLKFASSKKRIAIFVAPKDFYEDEYFIPRKLFIENKFNVDVISIDKVAIGSNGTKIDVDKQLPIKSNNYDALFVCGGKGMISASKNKDAQEFLKGFIDEKPIAMICHGPLLAAEAKVIDGVEITGWHDIVGKIKRAKGIWTGMPIEKSGLIFSAVGPDDAEDLAFVLSNFLLGKETLAKKASEEEEEFWKSHPELMEEEDETIIEPEEIIPENEEETPEENKKKEEILKKVKPEPKGFKDIVEVEEPEPQIEEKPDFSDIFEPDEEWEDVFDEFEGEDEEEENIPTFGEKLEPPTDKNGNVLNKWYDVEEIKPPVMSAEAKSLFTLENMKDGMSLTKLFEHPSAWRALKENPEIAQKWVLPAIIMGIGKRWFDNNSTQLKLGLKNKDIGRTPFGMFDDGDINLLTKGIPVEQLPSSRVYISLINKITTELANKYFSMGLNIDPERGIVPLGGYIYKALSREMSKNIAVDKGYKEKRVPVCSYCKSRANKRQSKAIAYYPMKLIEGEKTKVKQWYCEECKRKLEENKDIISNLENEVDGKQNNIRYIQERLNNLKKRFIKNPTEELQQKINKYEKDIVSLATDIKDVRTNLDNIKKEQYSLEVQSNRVPYWHTWCPSPDCPGNRVPLTAVDKESDFWKTDEGIKAIEIFQNRFGISILPSQSAEEEEPPKIAPHRIPPNELLNVPFICPHDYVKFTLKNARGKGLGKKGGFFWEPWQHMTWEPIGGRDMSIEEGMEEGVEANQEKVLQQKMVQRTNMYLSLLGSKMFSDQHKKALDEYKNWFLRQVEIRQSRGLPMLDAVKKAEQSRTNGAKQRQLSMYQALGDMAHLDPGMFVSWLGEVGVESEFIEDENRKIEEKNITKKITAEERRDNIYIPALHSWVSKMMETKEDWFNYYHLQDILVNDKTDGIYSSGPGTFFISKVGDNFSEEEVVFGFGCNLISERKKDLYKIREKSKSVARRPQSSSKPKVLKIIGMWKLYPEQIGFVNKWLDGKSPVPINNKVIDYAKGHPEENLVGEIMYSDFYRVGLNQADTSLNMGDYVLVQALVMPGKYNPEPVVDIRNIRNQSDGHKQIFSKVNAIMNEQYVDPESKALLNEFFDDIKNYGDDPKEMEMYMEDLIEGFEKLKKKASFRLSKRIASDVYDPPYNIEEIKENYPDKAEMLLGHPPHRWRAETGIELIHKEPDLSEQTRIWKNWQLMDEDMKKKSDEKSYELFGMSNKEHHEKIMEEYDLQSEAADPLFTYKEKRNFDETLEPEGEVEDKNKHRFVIQFHDAEKAKQHFDLRLENDDGTMSSWAIPKHRLPKNKDKLLAIKTEDHPISYMKFEGEIPSGYGKGNVKIYDSGTYEEIEKSKNKIIFKLKGKKETGIYNIFNTDGDKWIITKHKIEKKAESPFEKAQKSTEYSSKVYEHLQESAPKFNIELFKKEIAPKIIQSYNDEAKKMGFPTLPLNYDLLPDSRRWLYLMGHGKGSAQVARDYYIHNRNTLQQKMFPGNPKAYDKFLEQFRIVPEIAAGPVSGTLSHEMGHVSLKQDPETKIRMEAPNIPGIKSGNEKVDLAVSEAIASWNGFKTLWNAWSQYGIPRKAWGAWHGFPSYIENMDEKTFNLFLGKLKELETNFPGIYEQATKVLYKYDK